MTLTPEQLDELEAKAKAYDAALAELDAVYEADCHMDRGQAERNAENAKDEARDQLTSAVLPHTLHLVAVYRAALAWSEARDDVRAFADEIDRLHPAPITVGHEVRREALGGVVKARAVALEAALRGVP